MVSLSFEAKWIVPSCRKSLASKQGLGLIFAENLQSASLYHMTRGQNSLQGDHTETIWVCMEGLQGLI